MSLYGKLELVRQDFNRCVVSGAFSQIREKAKQGCYPSNDDVLERLSKLTLPLKFYFVASEYVKEGEFTAPVTYQMPVNPKADLMGYFAFVTTIGSSRYCAVFTKI